MRVAFVVPKLTGGGAERVIAVLASTMSDTEDMEVSVITERKTEKEYPLSEKVHRFCILKDMYKKTNLLHNAKALRNFFQKNHIDVGIGRDIYANWLVCLSKVMIDTKIIIMEANSPAHNLISKKSKFLSKMLYWRADCFVFQTEEEKSYYDNRKIIQKNKFVIHNPIVGNLPARNEHPNKEIIAMGRFTAQKNYPMLLRAFKKVCEENDEYILRVFGQGNLLSELKKIAKSLGLMDRVIFEDFCVDVHEKIKNSDIYVLSSDFEGMPNSLMEAMAMGFPVVSTDCPAGGARELIQDGVNGVLVPVRDEELMANALLKLIHNEKKKDEIGSNAAKILESHNAEKIVAEWMNVIKSIKN